MQNMKMHTRQNLKVFKKRIWPIENGDLIQITWKGTCQNTKEQCCVDGTADAELFGGPFEVVKADYGSDTTVETNRFEDIPQLPKKDK